MKLDRIAHRRFSVVAVAALLVAGGAASADDVFWDDDIGGSYCSSSNWTLPFPELPGADDTVIFDIPTDFTVSGSTCDAIVDRMLVRRGNVTFTIPTGVELLGTSAAAPALVVADQPGSAAALTLDAGPMTARVAEIGATDAVGILTLLGDGVLHVQDELRVGGGGDGVLTVLSSLDTGTSVIGQAPNATGQALVSGPTTAWTTIGAQRVGLAGVGTLEVRSGAAVGAGEAVIGQVFGSTGTVIVSGADSSWSVDGPLDVGLEGNGTLRIENGATTSCTTFATIGTFTNNSNLELGGDGSVIVRDPGSRWTVDGDLYARFLGAGGVLRCANGGRVTVTGDLLVGFGSGATAPLVFELSAASAGTTPAIAVTGAAGPLMSAIAHGRVELVPGYVPGPGVTFTLLTAGTGAETFGVELPDLPEGFDWVIDQTTTRFEIRVAGDVFGDLDGDGQVGFSDLAILLNAWGPCANAPVPCLGDLDESGFVGFQDLYLLLPAWSPES